MCFVVIITSGLVTSERRSVNPGVRSDRHTEQKKLGLCEVSFVFTIMIEVTCLLFWLRISPCIFHRLGNFLSFVVSCLATREDVNDPGSRVWSRPPRQGFGPVSQTQETSTRRLLCLPREGPLLWTWKFPVTQETFPDKSLLL